MYVRTCSRLGSAGTAARNPHRRLDPPPLGDTELSDAKARIGRQMFIKGNMNSAALLTTRGNGSSNTPETLGGKPGSGHPGACSRRLKGWSCCRPAAVDTTESPRGMIAYNTSAGTKQPRNKLRAEKMKPLGIVQ
jgi:hypothetical protein